MPVAVECGRVGMFLALALSLLASAAAQSSGFPATRAGSSEAASPAKSGARAADVNMPAKEDDFHKRVAARWEAARKGQITVRILPDAAHDTYRIHVMVTRAPSGSDGMLALSPSEPLNWGTLLKLDDEVRVRLSPEDPTQLDLEPHDTDPAAFIRHLDPGGHAEWRWTARRNGPGGNRFLLRVDVVYRRDFSPTGEPVVTYRSAESVISLSAPPI